MRHCVLSLSKTLLGLSAILCLSGISSWAAGYRDAVMADGPIAYWRFSEAPPTALNSGSLGASADGTYNGDAVPGAQAPRPPAFVGFEANNTAVQLDGAGDFVRTLSGLMNGKPVFTVSGWMRRNADQGARTGLWGQNDIVEFGYIANDTVELWTDDGLHVGPPGPIPNGEWAHFAIVSEGSPGEAKIYTNGLLASTRSHTLPADNAFPFNIGGGGVFDDVLANGNFFNGQIDEVAVFATALTAAKIAAQYEGASTPVSGLPNVVNIGQNKVGSVTNNPDGSITIVGGGNDIWDQRDEFTYAYTEVTGDFDVQVRVESLQANGANSKAGIMARESLSEFSRMAFPRVTPDQAPGTDNTRFAYRTGLDNVAGVNGGNHEDGTGASGLSTSNGWLRLSRIGNTLYSSNSTDGVAWILLGSQDTTTWGGGALSNKLFLGLGVCRNGAGPTAAAVFRDLQFNSNAAPFAVVVADSRGNPNGVRVSFNNPVGTGAFDPANYTLGTVSGPNVTVVTGLRLSTANDSPERDPMTFTLEGTTADPAVTTADPAVGVWTLIASGDTGLATDPGRLTQGPIVNFANANGYRSYRLLFPTVRDASANSMQVAEIELLDAANSDVTAPGDSIVGVKAIAGSSSSEIAVAGTTAGVNNYPGAEHPALAIDNLVATKYLNFAETNTGVIVTPSGGSLPADPTVTAAAAGPDTSTVQLTTSGLVEGATYELNVVNVQGSDGAALNSGTATFVHGAGYEARRIRITHNKTDDGGYYQNSDAVRKGIGDVVHTGGGVFPAMQSNTVFEDPIPSADNIERFSSRISGVLNIPTTGDYKFYVSSDDGSRLYLSTDENPANKVQIAMEPQWNNPRQYLTPDRRPNQENASALQNLQAGKKYYLELIYTEGGGGNNGSAAWQPPGGPAVANDSSPIPESAFMPSRLSDGNTFRSLGPVQIVSQPTNLTVTALLPATFRVGSDGTPNYTFQWRRNGQPIPGATGPAYTIPAAQITDDQAVYSVVVANEFSTATSSNVVLTVLTPTPPHLVGASSDTSFTTVFVDFDNRLELASAENIANYSITNDGGTVTITSATRDATARRVVLRTATALVEDTVYTLTVRDIHDETGTTTIESNPTNTTFSALTFAAGYIMRELYTSATAYGADSVERFITEQRAGTAQLRATCLTNLFEYNSSDSGLGTGIIDNFGGRQFGFFVPTNTGDHVFYFAADDFARLYLSTDANPANLARIAIEPVWSARRSWTGPGDGGGRLTTPSPSGGPQANISTNISLVAGQRYFIEAFFSEGGGGDNMAVAVQSPGDPVPVNGSSPITSINLGTFVLAGTLTINTQPQNQTNTENGFATFTIGATSSSSICGAGTLGYQWYTNGVAVPGANGPSFTTPGLSPSDDGTLYSVVVTSPGRSVTSSNAVLTVGSDVTGPSLVSVGVDGSFTNLFLTYNERINPGSAAETGNYTIKDSALNQIFVTAVITNANGSNVTLIVEPMQENTVYDMQVDFQTDLAGNVSVPDPIITSFQTWVRGCPGGLLWEAYNNIGGTAIVGLTGDPDFPNNPDERRTLNSFDTRFEFTTANLRDNFGARVRGFFVPPTSGRWIFYVHSDDASQLFLNPNGPDAAGKQMIAQETGCCRDWPTVQSLPIQLTGGRAYYIEGLYKEGGGDDYIRVAARLEGSTATLAAISGDQLGGVAPLGAAGNLTITQQPANTNVAENTTATFSVVAQPEFPQPVCYQWQRDSGTGFVDIPGATGTSYSFLATLADDSAVFRVRAGIVGNGVLSSNATLDVVNDVVAPTVLSARGVRTLDAITVRFSERMAATSAQEPGNYTLTDTNGAQVTLGTPVLSTDFLTVTIPTPPQAPGAVYTLNIAAISDQAAAGNQSAPTNFTFQTFIWSRGFATADYFFGIGGVLVSDLTNNAAYPNNPTLTEYVSLLEQRNNFGAGVNAQDNYGSHLYGQLIAPKTADYNFYVTSDDASSLYLSTDASPANNVLLASEPGWNGEREFINGANQASRGTPPANRSTTLFPSGIALTAGSTYYIELLAKEGGGGDNSSVALEYTGGRRVVNGSLPIHGTHLQALADPVGAFITITEQTTYKLLTTTNLLHGQRALISVLATGTNVNGNAPVVYQWQRSDNGGPWYDLNGANGNTFIAPVAAGKIADYRALIFIPGAQATSAPVHLVGEMLLTWTDPGVLQQAPTVTGPWTDIFPAATSPYLIDTADPAFQPMRFFRLRPNAP